ncbi:MAG: penicillin-binding protein 2 [Lutibacter sp.]|uniref:penicillin-binding protein 2 n=1 Tax=Lutibacter sp. TaxID=1925666 RepID=UPI0018012B36|nr:penicillin-binding protein 2 [Lutibacter sp.]MBT8316841.1 penicillin-binding protein 2 [Lutibacter sp.]NNJ57701.1 penicillin-binding protein 2 [Lutibacter sp.]
MKRTGLLTILIIFIGIVFIIRLFYLQVIDSSYDKELLNNSAVKVKYDYPERGYIYDRNGVLLVANQLSYDIMVIPREVKPLDTLDFCNLIRIDKETFIKNLNKAKKYSTRIPSIFQAQISKTDYAYFQEKMHKFKGFYIQKRSLREYPINSAPNVLGYISEVNENLIKKNPNYQLGELIGTAGVEKTYENILRGVKGVKFIQRNRFNKEIGPYKNGIYDTIPIPGKDITLTIDSQLQTYGESLMTNKRGGIVAIEPSTGEILAMVSTPTYDPNLMIGRDRSKNFTKLYLDTINMPLLDRGLQGEYPPGSPFKVITALTALQENVISTTTAIKCFGGYRYGNSKDAFMECHCGTRGSSVALNKAIYRSCNSYFANAYRKSIEKYPTPTEGMEVWSNHVKSFGLGNYLNNDLSVGKKGLIPSSAFYNKWYPNTNWTATYTISNAIGQGEILTTPIQLANMTAIVANKGSYYTPHIVKNIKDEVLDSKFTTLKRTTINEEHFDPVIEGLFQVFENPRGTASWSKVKGIEICGKTGTSENPHGQDHSIFIAFAPKDNPKIAIAVFVENGYWGSRWAGPIASLMIEKYLTGKTTRSWEEQRMLNGSLQDEYDKQLNETLKIED